jgi:hypothetical protein
MMRTCYSRQTSTPVRIGSRVVFRKTHHNKRDLGARTFDSLKNMPL